MQASTVGDIRETAVSKHVEELSTGNWHNDSITSSGPLNCYGWYKKSLNNIVTSHHMWS